VVSIDGGRKFVLAPQLAEVFRFIATGDKERSEKDPLVSWRSREAVLELLDSDGRSYSRRYVNNLVHRLRQTLRKAGYDWNLIQTHRQKGVRFAFKRGAKLME
jgi:transposase